MAGDFMIVNDYLVADLKKLGLWNDEMLEKLKFHDGSIQEFTEIPQVLRDKYKEAFEIDPRWLIKATARRGRWIDQSQSLNIFYGGSSGKELSEIYRYAWSLGLKTTYYLRTMGASRVEKATVNMAKFGSTSRSDAPVSVNTSTMQETTVVITPSPVIVEAPIAVVASVAAPAAKTLATVDPEATRALSEPGPALMQNSLRKEKVETYSTMATPNTLTTRPKVEIIGSVCESCEG